MRIEHLAIWADDLEKLKEFYVKYFNGKAGSKYLNENNGFESYFIEFAYGARLEIMNMPSVLPGLGQKGSQHIGYAHLAFSVGNSERVDSLTEELQNGGYKVVSAPRTTGDGYYESCILDPEGNRVEITT